MTSNWQSQATSEDKTRGPSVFGAFTLILHLARKPALFVYKLYLRTDLGGTGLINRAATMKELEANLVQNKEHCLIYINTCHVM